MIARDFDIMLIPLWFHVPWMLFGCSLDTQDLRRAIGMLIDFVWMMPVVSLKDATVVVKGEDGGEGEVTIVRITVPKAFVFLTKIKAMRRHTKF